MYMNAEKTVVNVTYEGGRKTHYNGKMLTRRDFNREFRGLREKSGFFEVYDLLEDGSTNIEGEPLTRVELNSWDATHMFKRRVKEYTYLRKMSHPEMFCYDHSKGKVDISDAFDMDNQHRILYFDIEALQFSKEQRPFKCRDITNERDRQEVTAIGALEKWSGKMVVFSQHWSAENMVNEYTLPKEYAELEHEWLHFKSEKDLLEAFVEYVTDVDPDVMATWAGPFYDLGTLYQRMTSNGIEPGRLSPFYNNQNKDVFTAPRGEYDAKAKTMVGAGERYETNEQPIRGRIQVDLMTMCAKQYRAATSNKLPSQALDVVGEVVIGRGKTQFCNNDDCTVMAVEDADCCPECGNPVGKPDFFDPNYNMWLDDYIYYLCRDVELMQIIDNNMGLMDLHIAQQCELNVPFESLMKPTKWTNCLFSDKAGFLMPDLTEDDYEDGGESPEGGYVLEVKTGVHRNVAGEDGASMYPSIMIGMNISHDTLDDSGEVIAEFDVKQRGTKDVLRKETVRFTKEFEGFLPKIMVSFLSKRKEYRKLSAQARERGDEKEAHKYDVMQKAQKVLANSIYGVLNARYPWGDPRLLGSVTYFGRQQTREVERYCTEAGYSVVAGHTDSCFIKYPSEWSIEEVIEEATKNADAVSKILQERYDNEYMVWELEQVMDVLIVGHTKNNYVGRKVWDADIGFDVQNKPLLGRLKMSGIPLRKTGEPEIAKEAIQEGIEILFNDPSKVGVNKLLKYLQNRYVDICEGKFPIHKMVLKKELGMSIPHARKRVNKIYHTDVVDEERGIKKTWYEWNTIKCDCGNCPAGDKYKFTGRNKAEYEQGVKPWRLLPAPYCGAAWWNEYYSNEKNPQMGKKDNFYYTYVREAPVPVPPRKISDLTRKNNWTGVVAFPSDDFTSLPDDFSIDYEAIAQVFFLKKCKFLLQAAGLDFTDVTKVYGRDSGGIRLDKYIS
jgi:DNA polymerase elongation subunit (family B)